MNDLQDLIAEDDGSRSRCDVDAELEGRLVDLSGQSAVFDEIGEIVFKSAPQALPTGVEELPDRSRIAHWIVGRRSGVDKDASNQPGARLIDIVKAGLVDEAVQRVAPGEIGLKQFAVRCAVFPRRIREAFVS